MASNLVSTIRRDVTKRGLAAALRKNARPFVMRLYVGYLRRFWGMEIGDDCMISLSAKLDKTFPLGIHIGDSTAVNFGAVVLTHDYPRDLHLHTRIGKRCQIGARSIIMPGVSVGDGSVVAIGSVVMKDVPPGTLVAGNPARSIEQGIHTGRWGKLIREEPPAASPGAG